MQDRFSSPRPTFVPTTNVNAQQAMTPKHKDDTPSQSVVARLAAQGQTRLAELIADSQRQARLNAQVIEERKKPRKPRKSKYTSTPVITQAPPQSFQSSDIVDDATFIRRTRETNIHTPEMMALFWANGGKDYMRAGLTYAQAFHNLRQAKMFTLRNGK